MSLENELVAAIYTLLSEDTVLTDDSGIHPETEAARAVAVYKQVQEKAPLPYVRITLTDGLALDEQPFDFSQAAGRVLNLTVNVFSDWEPEVRNVAARMIVLLQNYQITTDGFRGWSWWEAIDFYTDDQTDPDRPVYAAAIRLRCTMEAV